MSSLAHLGEVTEDDDEPRSIVERGDGVTDVPLGLVEQNRLLRRWGLVFEFLELRFAVVPLPVGSSLAELVPAMVRRDAVDPRCERSRSVKLIEVQSRLEEDRRRGVLGVVPVVERSAA